MLCIKLKVSIALRAEPNHLGGCMNKSQAGQRRLLGVEAYERDNEEAVMAAIASLGAVVGES